jgi:hypothetical protein
MIFLGLSAAAFAQAGFNVSTVPRQTIINTGMKELVGDLYFDQLVNGYDLPDSTIRLTYSLPISNTVTTGIALVDQTLGLADPGVLSILAVNNVGGHGVIDIGIDSSAAVAALQGTSFRLTGVRVAVGNSSINGSYDVVCVISTENIQIPQGQTQMDVAKAASFGIGGIASTAAELDVTDTSSILTTPVTLTEGFLNAWDDINALDAAGMGLRFEVLNLPAGITVTFPGSVTTDGSNVAYFDTYSAGGSHSGASVAVTSSGSQYVYYRLLGTENEINLEHAVFYVTGQVTTPMITLPDNDIQVRVTLWPDANVTATQTLTPTFIEYWHGPVDLFVFGQTFYRTTLLVPYAPIRVLDFDTGFVVANTTKVLTLNSSHEDFIPMWLTRTAQRGKIKFYFFPKVGDPFTLDTTDYPTLGNSQLEADGTLSPGRSFNVMGHELMEALEKDDDYSFSGYVIIVTDFANGYAFATYFDSTLSFSVGVMAERIYDDNTFFYHTWTPGS